MGYSLEWCAVQGKAAAVLAALGLRGSGVREGLAESPLDGAELPGGWYVVVADHDAPFSDDALRARLSAGTRLVTCFVEEHVMHSAASEWRDGAEVWAVLHDADQGLEHLEVRGAAPAVFAEMRARLTAALAEDDGADHLFDAPVELAKALTGFRHDEDPPGGGEEPFEILERVEPVVADQPGWLGRLLKR